MPFIEVEKRVFDILQMEANKACKTSNEVIKNLLIKSDSISNKNQNQYLEKIFIKGTNIQECIIPFIVKFLQENGGFAMKSEVEDEIY